MKKVFILLLMFTLFFAVSCDDDEGGGGVVRLQDLDSEQIHPADSTEAEGVGDKFTSVLSRNNSGWSAYRWTTSTDEDMPETTADDMDCDGAYKVSYFERAAKTDNIHRFVGGGMCLDSTNANTDARVVNLRALVDDAIGHSTEGINVITGANTAVDSGITDLCTKYLPTSIDGITTETGSVALDDENDELYLFIAEVAESTTMGEGEEEMSGFSATVVCHPDTELDGVDIYGLTDDHGNAFIKEVVDELANLDLSTDSALIDEGVWNAYAYPKSGDPDTLADPPKLSYFRISGAVGDNERRFIVGAGIYLDVDNPNVDSPLNKLEEIRDRVRGAAALLIEGENEAGGLGEMFFENDAADTDATDFYSQFIMTTPAIPEQEYIFVWENR